MATQDELRAMASMEDRARQDDDALNREEWKQSPRYIAVAASEYGDPTYTEQGTTPHALALVFHSMRHGAGQVDAFLTKSGLVELGSQNTHHPFLVFVLQPQWHRVKIAPVRNAADVAKYPPDTLVLGQWPGKWRSDWFMMTAGEIAAHLDRMRGTDATTTD